MGLFKREDWSVCVSPETAERERQAYQAQLEFESTMGACLAAIMREVGVYPIRAESGWICRLAESIVSTGRECGWSYTVSTANKEVLRHHNADAIFVNYPPERVEQLDRIAYKLAATLKDNGWVHGVCYDWDRVIATAKKSYFA